MTVPRTPNILVVDDQPPDREYLCECLARESYRCTGVSGARDALAAVRDLAVDVALLDLSVPGDGDLSLARRLRSEVRDLAVVMITGTQSFDSAVEAMRIGVFDYLLKPVAANDLLDAVGRAVEWRRAALRTREEGGQIHQQVAERAARLKETFADAAIASSAALDAVLVTVNRRNPSTLDHARRVAGLSASVALGLGIAEPLLGQVERAALLHDIGKIAIPDAVIQKPGPLTSDEFEVMRAHVQIGHDIAAVVPFLRPSAEIVLASHEHYDGSGYPRGLKGSAIPVGARIIAVTDVFDALTSPRVYRDPVSVASANAELVRAAGSHFDPHVVAAWLRSVDGCLPGHVEPWGRIEILQ